MLLRYLWPCVLLAVGCGSTASAPSPDMTPYGVKPGTPPQEHRPVATLCTRTSAANSCATDADCGSASLACACPPPDDAPGDGVCVPAFCHVDRDCGAGGYCSPSYEYEYPSCSVFGTPNRTLVGVFCHTAEDQCNNDDDCGSFAMPETCDWTAENGAQPAKWTCDAGVCFQR